MLGCKSTNDTERFEQILYDKIESWYSGDRDALTIGKALPNHDVPNSDSSPFSY